MSKRGEGSEKWAELPLFERRDKSGAWVKLSARDIGRAVADGWLSDADLVRLPLPGKPVRLVTTKDVLGAADRGASGLYDLENGPRVGPSIEVPVQTLGQPDPLPLEKLTGVAPHPSRRSRDGRNWRQLLNWKILGWVLLGYYTLGAGFWFFITSNPEPTFPSIVLALVVAIFKAGGILAIALMWVVLAARTEWVGVVVLGVAAFGLLVGATGGYGRGVSHLRANQLAPMSELVDRCMEEGLEYSGRRVGAVCADGRRSSSTGRGTCSHHGGVRSWTYAPGRQTRTVEECRRRAERIQW